MPAFTSGCSQFEGEDLLYHQRVAFQAEQQRKWATEQSEEKRAAHEAERQEEQDYAVQTDAITRMRGMLEDDMTTRKNAQLKAMQEENRRLAQQKREREAAWRKEQAARDEFELAATVNHGLETES